LRDNRVKAGQAFAMPDDKPAVALRNEVWSFEQRLRARTSRTSPSTGTQNVELARLLQRIAERRRSRGDASLAQRRSQAVPVATAPEPSASAAPGSVLSVTRVASHVGIVQIVKPAGFRFQAGQHMKLGIPGRPSNPYTIASAPSDPHLEFCIEWLAGGRVSPQLCALSSGARVALAGKASGDFLLVPNVHTHVMLATVTGISPFRSMLREIAARNAWSSHFLILHGASFQDELVYQQELQALAQQFPQHVRYVPSVSRPSDPRNRGFEGMSGRIADLAPAVLKELLARASGRLQVYACGHPEMVATAHKTLAALGLPVVSEVFD
jgi:ferredoxin-NADP reductase